MPSRPKGASDAPEQGPAVGGSAYVGGGLDDDWYMKVVGKQRLLSPEEVEVLSSAVQRLGRWEAARTELAGRIEREPTSDEMAEQLGLRTGVEYRGKVEQMRRAKSLLVSANLRLVAWIAKSYQNQGLSMQELVQEGTFGLIKAAERFDATRGFRLSTYATFWIRQAIARAIGNQSRTIRLPMHMHEQVYALRRVKKSLEEELQRPPTHDELAERMGLTVEKLKRVHVAAALSTVSMETALASRGGGSKAGTWLTTLEAKLASDHNEEPQQRVDRWMLRSDVDTLLRQTLSEREVNILRWRYGFEGRKFTLREISEIERVTRERVRQIELRALRKLRNPGAGDLLREYLDGGATSALSAQFRV